MIEPMPRYRNRAHNAAVLAYMYGSPVPMISEKTLTPSSSKID